MHINKMVITEKFKDKKNIMKLCLVAYGYEEDSHNLKTDSLTCSHIFVLTASVMK